MDSKYDCIVPVSGGRDSSYTLLKLVKDHHMKVLAVNYENPFTDPQAKANIENAIRVLGVDMFRFKLKNKLHERTFKNNIIAWFRKPTAGSVPMICIACKTIWWDLIRIANRYDIHCIVSGGNRLEQTSFKKTTLGVSADQSVETTLTKAISGILKENLKNRTYFRPQFIPTMVKGYLFGDPYTIGSRLFGRNITKIDLFFVVEWNEQEVLHRIKSELNWNFPSRFYSSWRFDCRVGHLKDYMYMKTIGMTEREDFYAKMVREGLITQDKALSRLKKENKLYLDEIELLLNEVGIENTSFLND